MGQSQGCSDHKMLCSLHGSIGAVVSSARSAFKKTISAYEIVWAATSIECSITAVSMPHDQEGSLDGTQSDDKVFHVHHAEEDKSAPSGKCQKPGNTGSLSVNIFVCQGYTCCKTGKGKLHGSMVKRKGVHCSRCKCLF